MGHSVPELFFIIFAFTLTADCRRCRGKLCNRGKSKLKFIHVSDIHLDPFYDKSMDESTWCHGSAGSNHSAAYEAPYGRIGCDSPEELLTITLAGMKEKGRGAKFIVLSGIELNCFARVSKTNNPFTPKTHVKLEIW